MTSFDFAVPGKVASVRRDKLQVETHHQVDPWVLKSAWLFQPVESTSLSQKFWFFRYICQPVHPYSSGRSKSPAGMGGVGGEGGGKAVQVDIRLTLGFEST